MSRETGRLLLTAQELREIEMQLESGIPDLFGEHGVDYGHQPLSAEKASELGLRLLRDVQELSRMVDRLSEQNQQLLERLVGDTW